MENKFLQKLDWSSEYNYLRLDILRTIFDRSDGVSIIKEIFPELSKRDYLRDISSSLLEFLLLHNENFTEEILYLLKTNLINMSELEAHNLEIIIYSVPEAIDIILGELKDLFKRIPRFELIGSRYHAIINTLTAYIINNRPDLFETYLNSIINFEIPEMIRELFITIIQNEASFDYNLIILALRNCKKNDNDHSFSDLPYELVGFIHLSDSLKDFLVTNFEELFKYERKNKLNLLFEMRKHIPSSILKEYAYLLKLTNVSIYHENNTDINTILVNGAEGFIKDYIGDNKVILLGEGTTAEAFRIGDDKILKLASKKYDEETEKEHFLLAPTEELIIKDDKGKIILHVEKQRFHKKVHNGVRINKDDLDNYFTELAKFGLEIQDPHCEAHKFDNFGFLDDYHEAILSGVNNHDELPDWFKKRPLVLFDIDMVKKKEKKLS